MGTPWMGFMKDEFGWNKIKGALSFGLLALIMGIPCVLFYSYGYFDEYDYWAGTVSLVIFALLETVLFSWIFGIKPGWEELNRGADMKIPKPYKWIIKFVTPTLLLMVFLGATLTPLDSDWISAFLGLLEGKSWQLDPDSLIGKLNFQDIHHQIKENPKQGLELEKRIIYAGWARTQLVLLFLFITTVVAYASFKRKSN